MKWPTAKVVQGLTNAQALSDVLVWSRLVWLSRLPREVAWRVVLAGKVRLVRGRLTATTTFRVRFEGAQEQEQEQGGLGGQALALALALHAWPARIMYCEGRLCGDFAQPRAMDGFRETV